MKPIDLKCQNGLALLIFVLMLMAVGGFVLVGYGQGLLEAVEVKKFKHNTRVLKEAKQALLMYAYRYPTTALVFNGTSRGPGRLPCPDTNNSGTPNAIPTCINGGVALVGRFPWKANGMEFYDAKDADGESLWYAVSQNFANNGPPVIRSDTVGTITLIDQSENIIYDGNGAGIAAIIIAPGPEMAGQDRNGGPDDPANFLDSFNGFDNAVFTNGESNANDDGFILGPVFDQGQNIIVINDQMIVITAAEVIEMAEKATLQAYRKTINDYLALTGDVYPWLYNYTGVPDVPGLSSYYPAVSTASAADFASELATNLDNIGRIPSIFDDYFTDTTSELIESRLSVSLSMTYPVAPTPVNASSSPDLLFNDPDTHTLNIQTVDKLTDVGFVDIAGSDGRLTGTAVTNEPFNHEIYFYANDHSTVNWTMCLAGADELSDCNRDNSGAPTPFLPNNYDSEILRVDLQLNFNPAVNGGVVNFDTDYDTAPAIAPPTGATGASHAWITATFAANDVIIGSLPLTASYEIDRHYHDGQSTFNIYESGTLDLTDFNMSPLTLGLRYYPELPQWAFDNGWHDSVMMAYANNYRPDIAVTCNEADIPPDPDVCLTVDNLAGNNDNKISILTIAGQHDWDDDLGDGFGNDIDDVFDDENADIGDVDGTEYLFDRREQGGNDKILVIEEI